MTLSGLVGQPTAVTILSNALDRGRVAHAYLFEGPESVGKRTAALAFAKALNCLHPTGDPPQACDLCRECRLIELGNHPDVRLITILPNKSKISIDQIRQNPGKPREAPLPLIDDANLKPHHGNWKVYLVDPADRLGEEAANTLLKVLEEPPGPVVLALITARPDSLPSTVRSRCQRIGFRLVPAHLIEQALIERGDSPDQARFLASVAGGRIGWALSAVDASALLELRRGTLELIARLSSTPRMGTLRLAEEIKELAVQAADQRKLSGQPAVEPEAASGEQPASLGSEDSEDAPRVQSPSSRRGPGLRVAVPPVLDLMLGWYRDLLVLSRGLPDLVVNRDWAETLDKQAARCRPAQIERALEAISRAKSAILRGADLELALEVMVMGLI